MNTTPLKFLSGLCEIVSPWLISPFISGEILPIGTTTSIGSSLKRITNIYTTNLRSVDLYNMWGLMAVNDINGIAPIQSSNNAGTHSVSLLYDPATLQVVSNKLTVKTSILNSDQISVSYTTPLSMSLSDSSHGVVSLNYSPNDFEIEESKLKIKTGYVKGIGAVKSYKGVSALLAEGIDYISDFISGDYTDNVIILSVKTSKDTFQQTGGVLEIKSPGGTRVPVFNSVAGFDSFSNFTYNNGIICPGYKVAAVSYTLANENVPSVSWCMQMIQSTTNSAIDILARQGTASYRNVQVRVDNATIGINASNNLYSKTTYTLPLKRTDTSTTSVVSLDVDGSSIKVISNKLAFGLSGAGININNSTSTIKVDIDSTLKFLGNQLSINLIGDNPVKITNGNQIGLKINVDTMELMGDGALSSRIYSGENGINVVGYKIRGAYTAGNRITITNASISCNTSDIEDNVTKNAADAAKNAADLITAASTLGTGLAASAAAAATGIVLANSAIAAAGVNSGLIAGLTSALGVTDAVVSALGLQNQVNTGAIAALGASTTAEIAATTALLQGEIAALSIATTTSLTGLTSGLALTTSGLAASVANVSVLDGLVTGILTVQGTLIAANTTNTASIASLIASGVTQGSLLTGVITDLAAVTVTTGINTSTGIANTAAISSLVGAVSALSATTAASFVATNASIAATDLSLAGTAATVAGLSLGAIGMASSISTLFSRSYDTNNNLDSTNQNVVSVGLKVAALENTLNANPFMKRQVDTMITSSEGKSRMLFLNNGATYWYSEMFFQNSTNSGNLLTLLDTAATFNSNVYITGDGRVATREWVGAQGYLTSASLTPYVSNTSLSTTLNSYATTSYVSSQLSNYITVGALATSLGSYMALKPSGITSSNNKIRLFFDTSATYIYQGNTYFQNSSNSATLMNVTDSGVNISVPLTVQGDLYSNANKIATQVWSTNNLLQITKINNGSQNRYLIDGSVMVSPNTPHTDCGYLFNGDESYPYGVYSEIISKAGTGELVCTTGYGHPSSWRANPDTGIVSMESGLKVSTSCEILTSQFNGDSLLINSKSTGNRDAYLDLYAYGTGYSSRFWRKPGSDGRLSIVNEGSANSFVEFDNRGGSMFYWDTSASTGKLDICWAGHFKFRQSVVMEGPLAITGIKMFTTQQGKAFAYKWNDVQGASNETVFVDWDFSIMAKGSVITNGCYFLLSDRRIKKDIVSIPDDVALDIVETIKPVSFAYKSNNVKSLGFIAQEVSEHLPTAVLDMNNRMCVNTDQLLSVLWKAVGDLSRQVKELKKKNI